MAAPGLVEEPVAKRPATAAGWTRVPKLLGVAVVAGFLGLLVYATLVAGRGSSLVAKIREGKGPAAPQFELNVIWPVTDTWPPAALPAIADGRLKLSALRGHPVVINFWASWCVPCRDEAPILHAGALRHRGQVVFLGVDVKDFTSDARGFARKYKVNYVSVRDGSGDKTWNAYGLTGVPETYFLDAAGRILAHAPGAVSTQTLEEGIATITRPAARAGDLSGGAHVKP